MLYWGIFTSGFIIGAMFASFLLDKREVKGEGIKATRVQVQAKNNNIDPDTLFDQITQINYFPQKIN